MAGLVGRKVETATSATTILGWTSEVLSGVSIGSVSNDIGLIAIAFGICMVEMLMAFSVYHHTYRRINTNKVGHGRQC